MELYSCIFVFLSFCLFVLAAHPSSSKLTGQLLIRVVEISCPVVTVDGHLHMFSLEKSRSTLLKILVSNLGRVCSGLRVHLWFTSCRGRRCGIKGVETPTTSKNDVRDSMGEGLSYSAESHNSNSNENRTRFTQI